jgi:chromate reductase
VAEGTALVGLVGSLRSGSYSRAVFETAQNVLTPGVALVETPLREVPFFDADLEAEGDPPSVQSLKHAVRGASGLIVCSPEYNASMPGLVKNAVDWLSRPYHDSALRGRPVGIIAISGGRRGGAGVRRHLMDTLGVLTDRLYSDAHLVGDARRVFDESGRLVDKETAAALEEWLSGFVAHVCA